MVANAIRLRHIGMVLNRIDTSWQKTSGRGIAPPRMGSWPPRRRGERFRILRDWVLDFSGALGHGSCVVMIGIGGTVARPPLPHHRTCGSAYGGSVRCALVGRAVRTVLRHHGFGALHGSFSASPSR